MGTAARHGLLVAGLGLAFLFRLPKQVGALAADGFGAFLRGAKRQLGLQFHGFDLGECLGGGVAGLGGGFLQVGIFFHPGEPVGGVGEFVLQFRQSGRGLHGVPSGAFVFLAVGRHLGFQAFEVPGEFGDPGFLLL